MRHHDSDELLFSKHPMYGVIDAQTKELAKAVEAVAESRLRTETLDNIAEELASGLSIDVPSLVEADITVSPAREVELPAGGYGIDYGFTGRGGSVKGTAVTFSVPYHGDRIMFYVRPNTFNSAPPRADVGDDLIEVTVKGQNLQASAVKQSFEATLKSIKEYLGWQKGDVDRFNSSLKQQTYAALEARKSRLMKNDDLTSGLGYKVK